MSHYPPAPPDLNPLVTDHPASCAYAVQSPCYGWSFAQQEAMARALVQRDREVYELRRLLWDLSEVDFFATQPAWREAEAHRHARQYARSPHPVP